MPHHKYSNTIDANMVEAWVKGWALAREVPAPIKSKDHFKVDVGWAHQKVRYVFPKLTETFRHLAHNISEPWHFLKICMPPEAVATILPAKWTIQPVGYMMTCNQPMHFTKGLLPEGYKLDIDESSSVPIIKVIAPDDEVAAVGRIAFADGYAIYDRIETHLDHRRRGLASIVIQALEQIMHGRGVTKSVLVATAEGKLLYEKLGWQLYSLYTTAVIPG